MKGVWLAIGIILLFVGICIIPATAKNIEKSQSTSQGNWLYVGGSGPGNYTKIQDAINSASDGDTVFVYSGLYNEGEIHIQKALHMMGEDRNMTIVNGWGHIFYVFDDVQISNFSIRAQYGNDDCIYIVGNNNVISDNIICTNTFSGIFVHYGKHNTIKGNVLSGLNWGICLDGAVATDVFSNMLTDNFLGISLWPESRSNLIHDNIIIGNNVGVTSGFSYLNSIYHNNISENDKGIYLLRGGLTLVTMNNICDNSADASFEECGTTRWKENYWGEALSKPKHIDGTIKILIGRDWYGRRWWEPRYLEVTWIQFDWHPAQEPYDIL
jgi:parallel beta-helix repeat protein